MVAEPTGTFGITRRITLGLIVLSFPKSLKILVGVLVSSIAESSRKPASATQLATLPKLLSLVS